MKEELSLYIVLFGSISSILLFFVVLFGLKTVHVENMAKAGYQECLEEGKVLWQKECYKID